jgi:putative phosphoribosyl transferase
MSPALLLPRAVRHTRVGPPPAAIPVGRSKFLDAGSRLAVIPAGSVRFKGTFAWPSHPSGFILITRTRRGRQAGLEEARLAARLHAEGLGTLVIDRLDGARATSPALQPEQIPAAVEWLAAQPEAAGLPLGCLGIGAGAGAALAAAASVARIGAVASCGGDPGQPCGGRVPALEIVGGKDHERLRLAQWFVRHLVMEPAWRAVHS